MARPINVLIIEDSEDDAELICIALEKWGFTPYSRRVATAKAMRAALTEERWDVVLSDYMMPSFDGLKALQILKSSGLDLPFILVSGSIGEDIAVASMRAGAHDYLMKDQLARLAPAVERELQEAKVRAAIRQEIAERKKLAAEREHLLQELQNASQLKDQFLAGLSHELRTPINAIIGWSDLLWRGKLTPQEYPTAFEVIFRNAKLQQQLIEDLLDVSRIISGKLAMTTAPLPLEPLIRDAVATEKIVADAQGIDLILDVTASAGSIMGDSTRIQQVILNLLSNALKFTHRGGRVDVKVRPAGANVEITVRDTGEGIGPEFLPFVFERFRQAESSMTRRHGGLGLGLTIVRHLVEAHHGQIVASSEGKGKGATFKVTLPRLGTSAATPLVTPLVKGAIVGLRESGQVDNVNLKGKHILVVDDAEDILTLLRLVLGRQGAEVTTASSAAEAMAILGNATPDAILSDIGMPDEDGYSLIRKIRKLPDGLKRRIPAAALTAHVHTEDQKMALAEGFDMHIAKPVEPKVLVNLVMQLLAQN